MSNIVHDRKMTAEEQAEEGGKKDNAKHSTAR
jgi:hypothetical protein